MPGTPDSHRTKGLDIRRKKLIIISAGLLAFYAILGFFVVPPIVRPKLVEALSEQTGCPVAIGNVRVNPFTLSVTIEDFALLDHGRNPVLSFDKLYINFQTSSLFRRAYTFGEIRLSSPKIFVGIDNDGRVNLEDIRQDTVANTDTVRQSPPRVIIQELAIDSGKIVFEDRARHVPFRAVFDSLGLSLRDFTTLPNEAGEYQFEASTGRNELIRWRGNVSVVPLRSAGSFELKNIRMRRFWEYMQDRVNFEASTGSANFHAGYVFDMSQRTMVAELNDGALDARDIEITSTVDGVKAVQLPVLTVGGIHVNYAKKEVEIKLIATNTLALSNVLSTDGRITLKDMFVPKTRPAAAAPPAQAQGAQLPWKMVIQNIDANETIFRNEDRSTQPPAVVELAPLNQKSLLPLPIHVETLLKLLIAVR